MEQLIQTLGEAARKTLRSLSAVDFEMGLAERAPTLPDEGITALAGLVGDVGGHVTLWASDATAQRVAIAIHKDPSATGMEPVMDAFSEVLRLTLDAVKPQLMRLGWSLEFSPTVALRPSGGRLTRRGDRCLRLDLHSDLGIVRLFLNLRADRGAGLGGERRDRLYAVAESPKGLTLTLWPASSGADPVPVETILEDIEKSKRPYDLLDSDFVRDLCGVGACRDVRVTFRPSVVGRVQLHYAADHMQLSVSILPPRFPNAPRVDREDLQYVLRQHDVTTGILHENFSRVLESQPTTPNSPPSPPVLIAQGTPPRHGRDAQILYAFSFDELRPLSYGPEGGLIDFIAADLTIVDEDTVLATRVPPGRGIPGKDVFGRVIPAQDGEDRPLPAWRHTKPTLDGTRLLAKQAGYLRRVGQHIEIMPRLIIEEDVHRHHGLIEFPGPVEILGGVYDGAEITALRGLSVRGEVRGAQLACTKGTIKIEGAVMDARLESGWDVAARALWQSKVVARGSVIIDEFIRSCHIRCGLDLIVVSRDAGEIAGGDYEAGHRIEAERVGAASGERTELRISPHEPSDDAPKSLTDRHIWRTLQLHRKIDGLRGDLQRYLRDLGSIVPRRTRSSIERLLAQADETSGAVLHQADDEVKRSGAGRGLFVRGELHAGTVVHYYDLTWTATEELEGVHLTLVDDKVVLEPWSPAGEEQKTP